MSVRAARWPGSREQATEDTATQAAAGDQATEEQTATDETTRALMPRAMRVCPTPGCPNLTSGGRCQGCRSEAEERRGSRQARGYDAAWERKRARYLTAHPICVLCSGMATVADHHPTSRRDLLAQGVTDLDADHRLRALCAPCHSSETARLQPGGWNR